MEIIAWRGASWKHLENTLEACQQAVTDGYDSIEIDTRLSSDGVLMAYHSPTLQVWGDHRTFSSVSCEELLKLGREHRKETYGIWKVNDILGAVDASFMLHVKRETNPVQYYNVLTHLARPVDIHSNSERHLEVLRGHPMIKRMFKSCYTPQNHVLDWVDGYMLGHRAYGDLSALQEAWLEKLKGKVKYVFAGNAASWINEVKQYEVDGFLTGRIDRV